MRLWQNDRRDMVQCQCCLRQIGIGSLGTTRELVLEGGQYQHLLRAAEILGLGLDYVIRRLVLMKTWLKQRRTNQRPVQMTAVEIGTLLGVLINGTSAMLHTGVNAPFY